jgi:hypothetical protein
LDTGGGANGEILDWVDFFLNILEAG